MPKLRIKEIKNKSTDMLKEELNKAKKDLLELRVAKKSNSNEKKISQIKVVRKNIARILTDIRARAIDVKRKEYDGKAFIPKQLRPKLTRKLRLELTPAQKNIVSRRQRIIRKKFPTRK
mmetsp:Transcript_54640/g.46016  ORF Transcript_54640/g.46016 Transcript_54640/m.46016 type:complete len:119 (-) Transcript_54640:77-433(-)